MKVRMQEATRAFTLFDLLLGNVNSDEMIRLCDFTFAVVALFGDAPHLQEMTVTV